MQKQPELMTIKIATSVLEVKFLWLGGAELDYQLTTPNLEITGWKECKEALAIAKNKDAFVLCSLREAIAMRFTKSGDINGENQDYSYSSGCRWS